MTRIGIEAAAQILLGFSNGASAVLSYSGCYSPYIEETVFNFTNGVAKVCGNRELWISEKGSPFEYVELDYTKEALEMQLIEFLKFLDGEESEVVTPEYAREVIRVLQRAFDQM